MRQQVSVQNNKLYNRLMEHQQSDLKTTIAGSLLILLFEFIGTTFLTLLYLCSDRDWCGMLLGIFVLLIFAAKTSGAHFNPAITLAFMLRKETDGRFSKPLGLAYIIFQALAPSSSSSSTGMQMPSSDSTSTSDSLFSEAFAPLCSMSLCTSA
ncbi:hypothetical protein FGO68_gene4832 [Halteria grandinella]|uniref:Uncharacterized protein n=1 Tax=Halteria grandinella TaxID=5974 RepID=A0A8J8NJX5_HALGN|nr:hypothetical protein FGO68_gene4832 [Halteria grandinella]